MMTRTAFEIDCNPVIPECGFACPQCIEEIKNDARQQRWRHERDHG